MQSSSLLDYMVPVVKYLFSIVEPRAIWARRLSRALLAGRKVST